MTFSDSQRHQLAQLLREVGPDAPTLCEGWTTQDLLIHLVIRENYPRAASGMFSSKTADDLAAKERELRTTTAYADLVNQWENGSRFWVLNKLDPLMNVTEHFIHLEDVRRAQPGQADQPQQLDHAAEKVLLRAIKMVSKLLLRDSRVPVVAQPDGWPRVVLHDTRGVAHKGNNVATVSGSVGEIALWLYGRTVAQVTVADLAVGIQLRQL